MENNSAHRRWWRGHQVTLYCSFAKSLQVEIFLAWSFVPCGSLLAHRKDFPKRQFVFPPYSPVLRWNMFLFFPFRFYLTNCLARAEYFCACALLINASCFFTLSVLPDALYNQNDLPVRQNIKIMLSIYSFNLEAFYLIFLTRHITLSKTWWCLGLNLLSGTRSPKDLSLLWSLRWCPQGDIFCTFI